MGLGLGLELGLVLGLEEGLGEVAGVDNVLVVGEDLEVLIEEVDVGMGGGL